MPEGKGQKKNFKNIVKPEKMSQITCIMDVRQKDTFTLNFKV